MKRKLLLFFVFVFIVASVSCTVQETKSEVTEEKQNIKSSHSSIEPLSSGVQIYANLDGDSGVYSYEYGEDFIRVTFRSGETYLYTYDSAGFDKIEMMKKLADKGDGLNSYIMTDVYDLFARTDYVKKDKSELSGVTLDEFVKRFNYDLSKAEIDYPKLEKNMFDISLMDEDILVYTYIYDKLIIVRLFIEDEYIRGLYYASLFPDDMNDDERVMQLCIDDNHYYRFACQYGIFEEYYLPPDEGEAFQVGDDWYIEGLDIEEGILYHFIIGRINN